MNKSKQSNSSRNKGSNDKQENTGTRKSGKQWKKSFHSGKKTSVKKTERNSMHLKDPGLTNTPNGFTCAKDMTNSKKQKLLELTDKLSSEQKLPQVVAHKELQMDVKKGKKTDRHSSKHVENLKPVKKQTPKLSELNRQQKRRKNQINVLETTAKKRKKQSKSDSDSDVADYIDQFFQDVAEEDSTEDTVVSDLFDPSQISSEEEEVSAVSESESADVSSEDGNAMSLAELVDFYGNSRDKIKNNRKAAKLKTPGTNPGKVHVKSKSSKKNGWIEEENDVDLVYDDSDIENGTGSKMLLPVGNGQMKVSDNEQESVSTEDSGDEHEDNNRWMIVEEEESDAYEEADSDIESVTSDSDYSESDMGDDDSYLNDHEFSSDYDSEESDDLEDSNDEYASFWDESYDSDEDDDYIGGDEDDLYISRGAAQIYEIDDNQVSFNSDIESAQLIELPCDSGRKRSLTSSGTESQDDDNTCCPKLVPIYDAKGNLINSPEKLERSKIHEKIVLQNPDSSEQNVNEKRKLVTVDHSLSILQNSTDASKLEGAINIELDPNAEANSSYHFYDSIDLRMSLLVLRKPIYFSGHLTIQPLIGGLEVMGYSLRPGECRSAYAIRGFHSLNFSPLPETVPFSLDKIHKVMARLEKHFQVLDLKEIQSNFDPATSVLVLLQADCSNKKITVVDKYLSEDFLIPKVEFLKKSIYFTTEHLLNVEFYTEHSDKNTSLFKSDPEWDKIEVKKNSKIIVMGGKGSGKSTLCQYLINKNVSKFRKVVLIDLDIGQPIQHIPETISVTIIDRPLLGVATFSPIKPAKSWLFGSLDIVSSLIFYIQNVRQLLSYCKKHQNELVNIPWIINTMGYVTDFGEELMAVVLRMFSPTDVIQLVSTNKLMAISNFQNRLTSEFVNQYSFNILRSEVQEYIQRKTTFKHYELNVCYAKKGFTLNAPKRRFLMLLAHLADILHDTSSEWFNDVKPFCAPLNKLQILITREDQTLGNDQLPSVLNATLVYLCQKDDGGLYECFGIGIVRGVDKNNNVYLLQSLPPEHLVNVNVLAICSSSLPNAVFLRQSARVQGTIPYVYNID